MVLQANYCQAFILKVSWTSSDSLGKHTSESELINDTLVTNRLQVSPPEPLKVCQSLNALLPQQQGDTADQSSLLWQRNWGKYTAWTLSFPHIQFFDWASHGWTQLETREQGRLWIPPTDVTFSGHRTGWRMVKSGYGGAIDTSGTIPNITSK